MKLVVFAPCPPPHHGASAAVELMLRGLGGDQRQSGRGRGSAKLPGNNPIACFHVDSRFSNTLEGVGEAQWRKIPLLVKYCFEAVWCRYRYGVHNIYYIPASPHRVPLYRDWLVMAVCRLFFRKRVLHMHAVGLGSWLETAATRWERYLSEKLIGGADVCLILNDFYRSEAVKLRPRSVVVVPVGIPDGCPDFEAAVLPRRRARAAGRRKLLKAERDEPVNLANAGEDGDVFRVLWLGMCDRQKGLFDALDAVALLNERLRNSVVRVRFSVVGHFKDRAQQEEFERRIRQTDLQAGGDRVVHRYGFVDAAKKNRLLRDCDCLCFPTWYSCEGVPATLLEAMSYGLPVVTTRWRAIPDLLPAEYPGLVDIHAPAQVAEALFHCMHTYPAEDFRAIYLARFTQESHLRQLQTALVNLELEP